MTAALEPVRLSLGQLVSIQIDLNTQGGSVTLSVTSCGTPALKDCPALQGGYAVVLQRDADVAKTLATAAGSVPSVESWPRVRKSIEAGGADLEDSGRNTKACSGPATPEQADTVGAQVFNKDEKPNSSGVDAGSPRQCALVHCDSSSSTSSAKGAGDGRFTCPISTAGGTKNSGPIASPRLAHAASTAACEDLPANPGARAEATSTAPGLVTGEKATLSPLDGDADRAPAVPLSVLKPSTVGISATATSEVSSSDFEPVTPTTPPRQPLSAPLLPPLADPQRMTLVLDLDGTLIASEDEPHAPVPFDYCVDEERFVWLRPGLRRFLDSVRPHFEVVLFTAAGESWATSALQRIDPDRTIFDSRLYRDHTVSHDDWPWVKDLSRLGRDLARVVIVDDNPLMFMYQPDNALHVAAYDPQLTGHSDDVLEQVLDVLMHKVLIADDVRDVLRNHKDPVTASCMAARHAALKAVASVHATIARAGLTHVPQGRKSLSSAAAPAGLAAAASASDRTTSDAPANQSPLSAVPTGAPGKLSRRERRLSKQQQLLRGALVAPGMFLSVPHGIAPAVKACALTSATGAVNPQPEKRQRRPRSRRHGGGAGSSGDTGADAGLGRAATRAPTGHPPATAASLAAVAQRPPVVVTRVRGLKHCLKGGAGQIAGPSLLQQPEQQLQLKLKLLQLQREQEEVEEGEGILEGGEEDARGHQGERSDEQQGLLAPRAAEQVQAWGSAVCTVPTVRTSANLGAAPSAPALSKPSDPAPLAAADSMADSWKGLPAVDRESVQVCSGPKGAARSVAAGAAAKGAAVTVPDANEQKVRSRRRRRRRPAGAAGLDDQHAPSTRVIPAKSSAAGAVPRSHGDEGNDLIAAAARRVLQDRS